MARARCPPPLKLRRDRLPASAKSHGEAGSASAKATEAGYGGELLLDSVLGATLSEVEGLEVES